MSPNVPKNYVARLRVLKHTVLQVGDLRAKIDSLQESRDKVLLFALVACFLCAPRRMLYCIQPNQQLSIQPNQQLLSQPSSKLLSQPLHAVVCLRTQTSRGFSLEELAQPIKNQSPRRQALPSRRWGKRHSQKSHFRETFQGRIPFFKLAYRLLLL
jgi:hypothetical protein